MRHRLSGITYGFNGLGKGDNHSAYAPLEYYITLHYIKSYLEWPTVLKTSKPLNGAQMNQS